MKKFEWELNGKTYKIGYITTEHEAQKALELLYDRYPEGSKDVLGLDIETMPLPAYKGQLKQAGLQPHLSKIAVCQIFAPNEDTVFVFHVNKFAYHMEWLRAFLETRNFVAHYAQFEAQHLLHNKIEPKSLGCSNLLFSLLIHTQIAESKKVKTTLHQLAKVALGIDLPKDEQQGDWSVPLLSDDQIMYAAKDAIVTKLGAEWCIKKMIQYGVQDVMRFYALNKKALVPIARMSLNGIKLDVSLHSKMMEQWQIDEEEADKELRAHIPEGLNLQSPKQLSNWFTEELSKTPEGQDDLKEWPRTPTGNLSCDADTLSEREYLEVVAPLAKYKKAAKLNSTYGRGLQAHLNPVTKRIHASFSLCYTDTGRMSSFDPNLQNLPRGKKTDEVKFKQIFIPEPGNVFVCADLGQIEVRVIAYHAKDERLIRAFEQGIDPYYLAASDMLKKPMSEVTEDERQAAKAVVLGRAFGLGAAKLVKYAWVTYKSRITLEEAKAFIAERDRKNPILRQWQLDTTRRAEQTLMSTSRMGKIQKLPDEKYYNKSLNHPIQSDAAACMLFATIYTDEAIKEHELEAMLVLSVHDELGVECKEKDAELVKKLLVKAMEDGVLAVFPEATKNKLVECKIGKNWAEAK